MTVTALLAYIDSLYPNAATTQEKIQFLNDALNDVSRDFGPIIEDSTTLTVDGQERYDYPSTMKDINSIFMLDVANTTTPTLDSHWVTYRRQFMGGPKIGNIYYDAYQTSLGVRQFGLYPVPSADDYPVRIRYRRPLAQLSVTSLTAEPEIDSRYHNILAFYAAGMVAGSGDNPDAQIANYYNMAYRNGLQEMYRHYGLIKEGAKPKRKDNTWWQKGSFNAHY